MDSRPTQSAQNATPEPGTNACAFVAIGSNMGDSIKIVLAAMARMEELAEGPLLKSSLWLTDPVDCPPESSAFVNAVVGFRVRHSETPESLLAKLQQIESAFGRKRTGALNEPRTLDLDLIAFGAETRNTPELTVPHPRAHKRRFVLEPLAEIAPELVLPGQTQTVQQLLAQLPPSKCERIQTQPS